MSGSKESLQLLKPDPVEHMRALMAKGKLVEAIDFSVSIAENLSGIVKGLTDQRTQAHAMLFEAAARAGDTAGATTHFDRVEALTGADKLPDQAVEERYFRASVAIQQSPMSLKRKHRHMALIAHLRSVFELAGEIAECGCYRGLSSWMICATLMEEGGNPDGRPFDGTGFHIFDSFAGLSVPVPEDLPASDAKDRARLEVLMQPGRFACSEADVRRHLAAFPGIAYHPGWLPQSLAGEPERRYRFIHLDVDLYEPTLGALEYFYPRLVPGGVMLTDDYGWPGARQAFDEFCARQDLRVEELPTEQAVLRKPS